MNDDQTVVDMFRKERQHEWPTPTTMDSWVWLVTEVGEIGDMLMRLGYGDRNDYVRHHKVGDVNTRLSLYDEMADAYIMLLTLANHLGIDITSLLYKRLDAIKERTGGIE